jgi:hypothetical protein
MKMTRTLPTIPLLLCTAVILFAVGGWWLWRDDPSPATELPSRETAPVRLVGSAKCAECHSEQFEDYTSSGHSRTFWTTQDFPVRDKFDGLTFQDPERLETYHYFAGESGLEVAIPGKFDGRRFPLQFAFGSGEHALTFMTLLLDDADRTLGIEHRVSWFTGPDQAGLTPGHLHHAVQDGLENFGRIIEGEALERCFECHTTSCRIEGDRPADLVPNVGCESCHTGGAAHVDVMEGNAPAMKGTGFADRPWRTGDQIQICAHCHRGEANLQPDQIRRDNWKIVRFQPVGLVQSECFKRSEQLLCSTCHDPHQHAAQRTPLEYEQKCLACHSSAAKSVACPVSPASDCIGCHMPRVEVHPSISFHDHWIRVRGEGDPPAVTGGDP